MTTHPTLRPSTMSIMAIQPSGLRKLKSEAMAALGAAAMAAPPWPGGGRLGRHCNDGGFTHRRRCSRSATTSRRR